MNDDYDNHEAPDAADDDLRALIALAAVDALDPSELERLDAAIADRPDLAAELDDFRQAAGLLAETVAVVPPAALRDLVLATVVAVGSAPDVTTEPTGAQTSLRSVPSSDEPVDDTASVSLLPRRRGWMLAVGSMAAAVVVAVAGVAVLRDGGTSTDDRIAAVVERTDVQTLPLVGELAGLRLHMAPGTDDVVIVGEGIPVPEGSDVYELWRIDDEATTRVEIFRPDDEGRVAALLRDAAPTDGVQYAVTVEPAGGVDVATGPIVASTG